MAARPPFFFAAIAVLLLFDWHPSPAAASEPLPIVVTLPLSGAHQALGREVRAAVELALDDAATQPAVTITWVDDACSSDGGLAAARTVTTQVAPPVAVIGHACPSAAQSAVPVYAQAGIVHITAGSLPVREPQLRRFGPRHFQLPGSGAQGTLLANALVEAGSVARVAFVRDKTQFAIAALQPASAALVAAGRGPPLLETFAGGEKDFAGLAQRLKSAGISHVVIATFPSEAVLLVAEIRKLNPAVIILATDQLAEAGFGRSAGAAADGVKVALAPDASAFPKARDVVAKLASNGIPASRAALASYAAIQVVMATAASSPATPAQMAETLAARTFETILGPVSFNENGAANLPSHVFYTWHNGRLMPPVP